MIRTLQERVSPFSPPQNSLSGERNFADVSAALQLQLLESHTSVASLSTQLSSTPRFTPSPPPASTSTSASLRLQALAHGLQVESLRQQVKEVQSRSNSRAASSVGDVEAEREVESESEGSEMSDSEEEEDVVGEEMLGDAMPTEMGYSRWVDERRLEEGEVDADGVPIKRRRTSALKTQRLFAVKERAGR
jgi:hypothetical protein